MSQNTNNALTNPAEAPRNNAYDAVPYLSFPFPQTNPQSLRAIASLFGLNAPDVKKARYLELGCASGNNLLSIATRYPESTCVGVDFSKVQIEVGQKTIADLGVKNLDLKCLSIMDIDEKFGKFDYIIAHGVFSWVPVDVQQKILEVCSKNLTEDGIAYVSYNTLPGWGAIQALREMMIYHTARFTDPMQKAEQARLLLKFIRETLGPENKGFYAEVVENELNILQNQSNWYLLHEHLEENNTQVYFHQFMDSAAKEGLQYLAETAVSTMFSGNLPAEAAKILATSNDIVRTEQYMDFIYNRRFRSTLLCHKDRILRRNISLEAIADKHFTNNFKIPPEAASYKFDNKPFTFVSGGNLTLTTSNQLLIAAVFVLSEQKFKPLSFFKLVTLTMAKLKEAGVTLQSTEKEIVNILSDNLMRSIFAGGILISSGEDNYVTTPSEKPIAYNLARFQAASQDWVTNYRQESTKISPLDRALLPLLDGTNDAKSLAEKLLPKFANDELNMNENNQKLDVKTVETRLPNVLDTVLKRYGELGLLEA